jgi:hypothetical protein
MDSQDFTRAKALAKCAEHDTWTSPPTPPAGQKPLDFSIIDAAENQRISSSGRMSIAMVGCSGDPQTQEKVEAVAKAITAATDTSFFYHLGDIIYIDAGRAATAGGALLLGMSDANIDQLYNFAKSVSVVRVTNLSHR